MIDAYYGYDDNGLVRTNLAGGVNREQLRKERGDEAVHELDRLGALTGVADTSGKKQDVYFCHDFCELGAIPSSAGVPRHRRLPRRATSPTSWSSTSRTTCSRRTSSGR